MAQSYYLINPELTAPTRHGLSSYRPRIAPRSPTHQPTQRTDQPSPTNPGLIKKTDPGHPGAGRARARLGGILTLSDDGDPVRACGPGSSAAPSLPGCAPCSYVAAEGFCEAVQPRVEGPPETGAVLGAAGGALQRCGQAAVGFAEDNFGEGRGRRSWAVRRRGAGHRWPRRGRARSVRGRSARSRGVRGAGSSRRERP